MPRWFAVATPGLEPVVARELEILGITAQTTVGGASFSADLYDGAALACAARTPARILLRVASGKASSLQELAALVRSVDWRPYLAPRAAVEIAASTHASRLQRRDAIEHKVEVALKDARRQARAYSGRPPRLVQRIQIRIDEDVATLSIDAGGELLHRRGWRQDTGRAPLRENLAASLLIAAGWDGSEALLDPFCGVGTIPIEAALLASGRVPWTKRSFAWEEWPALADRRPPRPPTHPPGVPIVGSDREPQALASAAENARRAGVGVRWLHLDVSEIQPPAPVGLVAANPPYGERLGQRVRGVYVHFGRALRERLPGWRAIFLAPNDRLAEAADPAAQRLTTFSNGGIRVGMYALDPAG